MTRAAPVLTCGRVRGLTLAVLVAMTVIACGGGSGDGEVPDPAEPTLGTAPREPAPGDSAMPPAPDSPSTSGPGAGAGRSSQMATPQGEAAPAQPADPSSQMALTPVDDLGGVGANGRAYLRGDRPRVLVEVDVQEGTGITDGALAHLEATLAQVSVVADVDVVRSDTIRSERRDWTAADLRDAAATHRDAYSDDVNAVLYVLVARGSFVRDGQATSAIGVAHNASELAVFPDRWADLTGTLLGSTERVERAVLVHELGHLLGLVNLTYESELDHEDPEHPHHSSNRDSVMYWAVETTAIGQVFSGPPPDTFDDADLADLAALRDGRA